MAIEQKAEQNGSVTNHQGATATTESILHRHAVEGITSKHLTPPDGGYGWVVMVASFFCSVIIDGVCFRSVSK